MGRREQARSEAAFMRGQTGVDGQATEEKADKADVERAKAREQFLRGKAYLGREFLTWLLWKSESSEPLMDFAGEPVAVLFCDRLVLKGIAGEITELSVKGAMAPYSPLVRAALAKGLLVHAGRVRFTHADRVYEATLDAESLSIRSAKLPELMAEEDDEQEVERLALSEQVSAMVEELAVVFLKQRSGKAWSREIVREMRAWMAG